jgi:hypothetical protein
VPILKREPDAFPESVFEMSDPWWVAHLKSRQEKVLARYLRERNVPFYLPQMEKRIRRSGRTLVSYLPLFAGYVFFRGGRDERLHALKSNVVVNVLEPQDQAEIDAELRQLHQQGVARLVVSVSFIRQSVALDIDREFIRPQRRL